MAKSPDHSMERNSRNLLRLLLDDGWVHVRTESSHVVLKKPGVRHPTVVVHPKKDLPIGLVRDLYKKAGWR